MFDLIDGFRFFWRGAALLRQPRLRRFVVLPLLVNIIVFALALSSTGWWFNSTMEHWLAALPDWLHWLEWILWIVFAALAMVVLFVTFTLVANLIGAPFNGNLAHAVQRDLGDTAHPKSDSTVIAGLRAEASKLGYIAVRGLGLMVLLLIPGLNLIAPVAWFSYGSWLMALEYIDYPLSNNGSDFRQARPLLKQHRWRLLGFGLAALITTLIPVLNFIAMPAAVVGATLLWYERLRN